MTIAQLRDFFAPEPHLAGAIIEHDEIVPGAIHLRKTKLRHALS
jgi:hypothetical protein